MTNILGLKQNRWIVGAVLLLTTCNLQAQEQPNAREKFEKGNWFVSGALNGEWLTKTIGNVYAGGKISGGVYLTPLSGFRATAEIGKNRIGNDTEATQLSANLDYMLTLIGNNGFKNLIWRLFWVPVSTIMTLGTMIRNIQESTPFRVTSRFRLRTM